MTLTHANMHFILIIYMSLNFKFVPQYFCEYTRSICNYVQCIGAEPAVQVWHRPRSISSQQQRVRFNFSPLMKPNSTLSIEHTIKILTFKTTKIEKYKKGNKKLHPNISSQHISFNYISLMKRNLTLSVSQKISQSSFHSKQIYFHKT